MRRVSSLPKDATILTVVVDSVLPKYLFFSVCARKWHEVVYGQSLFDLRESISVALE